MVYMSVFFVVVAQHPVHLFGGTLINFLGPAALLQSWRFIADTRDEATEERLDDLEDAFSLYRCHGIMNCVSVCPKGLNPTEAISNIRNKLLTREKN